MHKIYFRYAPLEYLCAQGIAPAPPKPAQSNSEADTASKRKRGISNSPVPSDHSLDNLTPEEQEIYARLKRKAQKPKKPKREPQDSTAVEVIVLSD